MFDAYIGTLFSFVDKAISSVSATIVGVLLASTGYVSTLPQTGDPITPGLFRVAMFITVGLPALGWIASLISMKFYPLD